MPGAVRYPLVVSTLPWASLPGQWNLTIGLKATYTLAPSEGEPALSDQKDGLHEDVLFDSSPRASLYSPSDFVPFKARADVLLVGQAHAPAGVPTESLLVRLRVGDFAKALRVTGDRAWVDTPQGPRPSAPRPFASAALRYERALRRGENLAGVAAGDTSRPPAAIDLVPEEGPAETPGFGPIAASWRAARDPRLQDVLIWSQRLRTSPQQGPPPPNADPTLFNSAPRDQQPAEIHPGAAIVLDHLHPRFPRLEARIPSIVPRAFHVDARGAPRESPSASTRCGSTPSARSSWSRGEASSPRVPRSSPARCASSSARTRAGRWRRSRRWRRLPEASPRRNRRSLLAEPRPSPSISAPR